MKSMFVAVAAALFSTAGAFSQGTVYFSNENLPSGRNVPIYLDDGIQGPGSISGMAQLYLWRSGIPLLPIQPFQNDSPASARYIVPAVVVVPGVPAGSAADFVVRAWAGASSYETAFNEGGFWGESAIIHIPALGGTPPNGGAEIPIPYLSNLQTFNLQNWPEPPPMAIAALGGAALLILRRR